MSSPPSFPHHPADKLIRATDICLAVCILAVTGIPMLIIALFIRLEDGGPTLFRQTRVGRGGREFSISKFRTMIVDPNRASGDMPSSSNKNVQELRNAFQTTTRNDMRITKVGRILRPLHLDELPQVLNVLQGDMSLVGVRPDVPVQQADYTPQDWVDRHMLRPGITGLAQIDPTVDSMQSRTHRDLTWVRERSYGMYWRILLGTIAKVLKRNSL